MACMREFCGVWRLLVACCIFTCGSLVITAPGADALAFLQDAPNFLQGFIGLNLKINCSTDDPNATVSLWHGPNPFSPMTERLPSPNKIVKSGQVFTILNLIVSDAGNHKCKAQNKNQSIEWPPGSGMTFLTRAKLPDHFVLKPDTPIIIMTGQEGKVTCEADGIKIAKLQWNKVDGQVDTPVPDSMVTVVKDASTNIISATLRITNAQKQDDGIYKCVVTVFHKSEDRSARVEVKDPEPPKIEPYKKATTITEGTEKILKCIATAYPKPSVTWFKGGKQLNVTNCTSSQNNKKCEGIAYEVSEEGLNSLLHTTGVLKIRSALYPRDQGQFKCVASNEYYSDTLLIDLNVQVAPRLVKKRDPVLVPVETETQVVCTLKTSNPLPTFQWKYQTLDCPDSLTDCQPDDTKWQNVPASVPGSQTPTNESVVTVTKDLQSTFYQCNATNILGDDTHIVKLIRREKIRKLIELDPTRKTQFNEGSTLFLPCIDRCFFCDTHFTRDGLKLLPENDARVNVTKVHADDLRFTLTIKNLTLNDSGNYRCVGVDDPPQFPLFDAVNITIDALVKPNITKLIPYNGEEGSPGKPARLFCEVTANPPAKISWYFTNSRGERREITESNDLGGNIDACKSRASGYFYLRKNNRSHLVICSPKFEQHSGTYECRAENIVDSMSKTVFLDVFAAPTITAPGDGYDITLDIGEDLNETCIAKGNPSPEVMWQRNSTDGLEILGKDVGSVLLNIESVGEDDFRTYTCVASNKYGDVSVSMPVLKVDTEPQARTDPPLLSTSAMVGIAVGVGVFVLILLVIGCLLYRRQKKQMDEYKELYFLRTTDYKIDPDRSLLEQCNDLPYDPEWEFPEERLVLGDLLGSGAFGQVIKAEAVGIVGFNPREKAPEDFKRRSKIRRSTRAKDLAKEHTAGGQRSLKTAVAVKTLKEGASEAEYKDLASELKILIHLGEHKNIINLLGACTRGKRLMVIMEFAPHGSLLSFLRGKREVYEATWTKTMNNPEQEFTLVDLVMASYQISRGMAFLASKKCVHRDMAARNILVGNDYVMKIADFGLARDIYKDDLYVKKTSGLLPVKWMAPESLFDRVYNEKTDVWSFGILLWEAFTLGGTPYPGLPTEKLLDYLSEGKRMELPAKCPLEVYTVMRDCWAHDPDERPAFATLNERLGKVLERNMTKDNPYIALQMEEEEEELGQGYYLQPCESGLRESKRYVESPVHTPDREDHPGFEQGASAAGGENDDTRYGSPLPPLPPGLPIISDEDIQNAPLPPIPPSYEEALSDGSPPTSNGGGRESGIDMDDPGDGGEYIDDVKVKSPTPSRDGSKPVAIQMEDVGNGELPDTKVKTKGGRDANETEV